MMVKRNSGLIVNISSAGGLRYLFNLAYGVGKEAVSANYLGAGNIPFKSIDRAVTFPQSFRFVNRFCPVDRVAIFNIFLQYKISFKFTHFKHFPLLFLHSFINKHVE